MTLPADRIPIPDHPGFWRRGSTVCFKYRDHRRRQRWGTARTLREAKSKKAALETDVARGDYRAPSRLAFEEYAAAWMETYQGRTRKVIEEHTRADYRARLEQDAIPYFKGMLLGEIEPQDIKSFAAHVSKRGRRGRGAGDLTPLSENTVRLALAPVKALFATAFEEGKVRVNPAAGVRIVVPRSETAVDEDEEGDVKALSDEQLGRVLDEIATADERWLLFFRVLLQLGLRISEMVELRWRDVDLGARKVRIRRKFYRGRVGPPKSKFGRRTLKLPAWVTRELWALRKETRAADGDLVFSGARGARVDGSNLMSRVLKPAAVRAGVGEWVGPDDDRRAETWVGFHTFRHTCATSLFKRGWNPKQVQLWLGHHKASFTVDTYIHLLDADLPEPPDLAGGTRSGTRTGTQSAQSSPNSADAETG